MQGDDSRIKIDLVEIDNPQMHKEFLDHLVVIIRDMGNPTKIKNISIASGTYYNKTYTKRKNIL